MDQLCTASISTRAAMSARRSSRACSIAAPRARASCGVALDGASPEAGVDDLRRRQAGRHHGLDGRRQAASRCSASTASPTRSMPDCRSPPAASPLHAAPNPDDVSHSPKQDRRMSRAARLHADGKMRCPWPGEDPFYVAYHDTEWGVPEYDDRALYEKLILDGFQAGLSWITILRKRDNFRKAFDDFQPEKIARYNAEEGPRADERCRHRAQPRQDRRHDRRREVLSEDHGRRSGLLEIPVGLRRRQAEGQPVQDHRPACRPRRRCRSRSPRSCQRAASSSSARPSSMPSCRPPAWSTIISSTCFCHASCGKSKPRKPAPQSQMTARRPSRDVPTRAWQRMLSGRRLDLLDPSPLDIEIADIAHGLARVARWNGQTSGAHIFSVAQHTLLVEAVLREQMPRARRSAAASRRCCTTRRNMSSAT